ncbi:hypothetical protein [Geobacillus sp. B4113_201601]|uniref:hypothetical protein n=1 Tax=Geobacillus sp. B4113_201601 TaxID=1586290 RepID=UPI000781EE08|nr:hypothetical protein [Geobacillus sp. B4113_201601]KYD29940.1 hypothetical protein B4113_1175 [Geobacillus sp. B4113_201601]
MIQTYWERSIKQFFNDWKNMKTPLQHPEHFVTKKQEKILLTIDDLIHKTNQQPVKKKKRGRPKKKAI